MPTKEIFNSYNVSELRKFASGYNRNVKIAGASKMKKDALINELLKHKQHFKDVKMKQVKAKPVAKPVVKPLKSTKIVDLRRTDIYNNKEVEKDILSSWNNIDFKGDLKIKVDLSNPEKKLISYRITNPKTKQVDLKDALFKVENGDYTKILKNNVYHFYPEYRELDNNGDYLDNELSKLNKNIPILPKLKKMFKNKKEAINHIKKIENDYKKIVVNGDKFFKEFKSKLPNKVVLDEKKLYLENKKKVLKSIKDTLKMINDKF